jgi:hypothetical protein
MLDQLSDCWFLKMDSAAVELLKCTHSVFVNVPPDASVAAPFRFHFGISQFSEQD